MGKLTVEIKECNINFTDCDDMVSVTVFQRKHINQLKKLVEAHPDEVKMVADADKKNNGMAVFNLPKKYCKISFGEARAKREMTDEQKAAASERMKKAQEAKAAKRAMAEAENMENEGWL